MNIETPKPDVDVAAIRRKYHQAAAEQKRESR
jgi:hypothetical protein